MFDLTRASSRAASMGFRDARMYGWRFLHILIAETPVSRGVGLCFGGYPLPHLSIWLQTVE